MDNLLESAYIDGLFVVILIWFNLATILFAQSMMGAVLLKRANRIIAVPKTLPARGFLYFTLIITIPFLPCLLLLQVSSFDSQEWTLAPQESALAAQEWALAAQARTLLAQEWTLAAQAWTPAPQN